MEYLDLYNRDRIKTGKTHRRGDPVPAGYYRLAVHVCIFNARGQMLIQQRQPFKAGWPDKWDVTVGGSAVAGEDSRQAAERETLEEIGLALGLSDKRPKLTINFGEGFDDIYLVEREVDLEALRLQESEVQAVRWASQEEILAMIDGGAFIPYAKSFIELLFDTRRLDGTLPDA